jgi:hypothetical protein
MSSATVITTAMAATSTPRSQAVRIIAAAPRRDLARYVQSGSTRRPRQCAPVYTWWCTRSPTSPSRCRSRKSCPARRLGCSRGEQARLAAGGARASQRISLEAELRRGRLPGFAPPPARSPDERSRLVRARLQLQHSSARRCRITGSSARTWPSSRRRPRKTRGPYAGRSAPRTPPRFRFELRAARARHAPGRPTSASAARRRARSSSAARGRGPRTSCACTSPQAGRRSAATTSTVRRSAGRSDERAARTAPRRACARGWSARARGGAQAPLPRTSAHEEAFSLFPSRSRK